MNAQSDLGPFCTLAGGQNAIGALPELGANQAIPNNDPLILKLYFHVLRNDSGNGGVPEEAPQIVLQNLNSDFTNWKIQFQWDCKVNYIDNSDWYNSGFGAVCEMYDSDFVHADGIDIFMGKTSSWGGGNADGIHSNALFIGGYQYSSDGNATQIPVYETFIPSHEMGHCLGLWHTHNGTLAGEVSSLCNGIPNEIPCCELADQSNGNICGDYVNDTPADPGTWKLSGCNELDHFFFVSHTWYGDAPCLHPEEPFVDGFLYDYFGTQFTPLYDNMMGLGGLADCSSGFTDGQGLRMRRIISESDILQPCLIQKEFVNNSTVWNSNSLPDGNNGEKFIHSDLVITNGATLTIESDVTLRFHGKAKMIIEPNATVILKGKLTGSECSAVWQGVEVWGSNDDSPSTQFEVDGVRHQGRLKTHSGAIIENATVAVKLYGPTRDYAGGQISSNGTTFRNNGTAVQIADFANTWPFATPANSLGQPRSYFGRFTECDFITTSDSENPYPAGLIFKGFIAMEGVDGVQIRGCNFNNQVSPLSANSVDDYGFGIYTVDANFKVIPQCAGTLVPCNEFIRSSFTGLGYGIKTTMINKGKPYTVKQTDFSDCYFGIYNSMVSGATILFNDFDLSRVPDMGLQGEQIGVFFETGITGFTLQGNEFKSEGSGSSYSIGSYCANMSIFNNFIIENTYTGLMYANLASGNNGYEDFKINSGLVYLCNNFSGTSDIDIALASGNIFTGQASFSSIKPRQAFVEEDDFENLIYKSAANLFAFTAFNDIMNEGDVGIKYYFDENGPANEEPRDNAIEGDIEKIVADHYDCPEEYCEPPCRSKPEIDEKKEKYYEYAIKGNQARTAHIQAVAQGNQALIEEKATEASYYMEQMDKDAYLVAVHLMLDTITYDEDSLRTWLLNLRSFPADMKLILQNRENTEMVKQLMDRATSEAFYPLSPQDKMDLALMPELVELLVGNKRRQLNTKQLNGLKDFAKADIGFVAEFSRNVLRSYGYSYPPRIVLPSNQKTKNLASSKTTDVPATDCKVSPNPADNSINFNISLPAGTHFENVQISIFNTTGQLVETRLLKDNHHWQWDVSQQNNGLYFYQLTIDGENLLVGKFVVQH